MLYKINGAVGKHFGHFFYTVAQNKQTTPAMIYNTLLFYKFSCKADWNTPKIDLRPLPSEY